MSLLVISEILALLVNMLSVDHKYSHSNRDNLMKSIQKQLTKKQKRISGFFAPVLKFASDFEHFEKKIMTL